jgi:hypothetical protein
MGYVVGELLRDGVTKSRLEYVQTILQPKDADDGNPIPLREEEFFDQSHRQDYQQLGWRLDSIDVELTQTATRIARNLDDSVISPYVQMTMQSQARSSPRLKTETILNSLSASWKPKWIIRTGQSAQLKVCAFHAFRSDVELPGTLTVAAGSDAPTDTASGIGWSAKLQWSRVHY